MLSRLAAAILVLFAAGCALGPDADEARLCRLTLPALIEAGSRIDIQRMREGPFPNSLRIDYHEIRTDEPTRIRFVICRFSNDRNAQGKREFTGLATEYGPMADASFYLMRRFYLEARDGQPADPAPQARLDRIPQAPQWLAYGLQQFVVALPSAAIYALLAAAYALIYGLMGRILLVFGEFAALASLAGVVGVAVTFSLGAQTALAGVAVALAVGVAAAAIHGLALSRFALTRLARAPGQHVLIASLGAGLAISEWLRLMQGPQTRWLPPVFNEPTALLRAGEFVTTVTIVSLAAALMGLIAAVALVVWMHRSAYGRAWRAVADDPGAAALFGVDERRVFDRALVLAAALAGLAGVILTVLYGGMGFAGGFSIGLKALIAAILGGVGSIAGAALGGLAVAAIEAIWSATLPIEFRDAAIYTLLAIVLIVRPSGFFGHAEGGPRRF